MPDTVFSDASTAAVELIGRTGAKSLEIGYLHDTPRAEDADWWATVTYRGVKITEEHHVGPSEALEAIAVRLLDGAKCTHCQGMVALRRSGVMFYADPDGARRMVDGSTVTVDEARSRPLCHWQRVGPKWIRGCQA